MFRGKRYNLGDPSWLKKDVTTVRSSVELLETIGKVGSDTGLDCTGLWNDRWRFERPHYLSDQVDLRIWFIEEQINQIKSRQCEYVKALAELGW
jgi:hypothetical protein